MGPERFLLNCGAGWDSAGYCEGIRIGGDVGVSWNGMQAAISCTMAHLYKNGLVWWTDPDAVCVRPPLSLEEARLWVTLVGITGQLLMSSDKMYDLPPERVELLRRIYPVADIRPMDLYPLPGRPRLFDLRIATPAVGDWDVVAVFNWTDTGDPQVRLAPTDLGLPPRKYLFYDVWEKRLIAASAEPLRLSIPPRSCKVIAIRAFADHPQLLGTSRHLTQGADDLLAATWDADARTWSGKSQVVGGDPYELRFSLPPGWTCADGATKVEGPLAILTLNSPANEALPWRIAFRKEKAPTVAAAVTSPRLEGAQRTVKLTWTGDNAIGYRVYRDGELIAEVGDTTFTEQLTGKPRPHAYELSAMGWSGESARLPAGEYTAQPSPRGTAEGVWMDEFAPESASQDYGPSPYQQRNRRVDNNPLRIAGQTYDHGLGTHANSHLRFLVRNRYAEFQAQVGVDDEKQGAGTVVFQVFVDGEKAYDSGVMRGNDPAKPVQVSLDGADVLELVVTDADDGINCDHADWVNARLIGNR